MPSLDTLTASQVVKLLLIGDGGTGKTGSLVSLVQAGYKLRILDFDSGLDVLALMVKRHCPEKMNSIEYRTLDDKFKPGPTGAIITPYAFSEATKMLDKWKYKTRDGEEIDHGSPYTWGPECILVIDSLTFLSHAAFNWAQHLNSGTKDKRQIYGAAQDGVEHILAQLKSEAFQTNVIVISHVKYIEREDGTTKGYPTSVGSALSPNIPTYFNSTLQCKTNPGGKRTIQTLSTALIDLKNPAAYSEVLPIETGLATFFEVLRGKLSTTKEPSQVIDNLPPPHITPVVNSSFKLKVR
jgi:hypothetical protein